MLWSIEHYSQILQCFALLFSLALMWLKCKGALMPGTGRKCMQIEKSKVVGKWGFVGNPGKCNKDIFYSFGSHSSTDFFFFFLGGGGHFLGYSCRTKNYFHTTFKSQYISTWWALDLKLQCVPGQDLWFSIFHFHKLWDKPMKPLVLRVKYLMIFGNLQFIQNWAIFPEN